MTPQPHLIQKHSISIAGHRTSLSLESIFWDHLKRLAAARNLSLAKLIAQIDRTRPPAANLSSAIRVYVLRCLDAAASQGVTPAKAGAQSERHSGGPGFPLARE